MHWLSVAALTEICLPSLTLYVYGCAISFRVRVRVRARARVQVRGWVRLMVRLMVRLRIRINLLDLSLCGGIGLGLGSQRTNDRGVQQRDE